MGLSKFILCGHSFGGYIAALLNIKYPEKVEQLILLSPIGLSSTSVETKCSRIEGLIQYMLFKIRKSPSFGFKYLGVLSHTVFNHLCEGKFKGLPYNEYLVFRDFMNSQFRKNYSSDPALFAFFDEALKAYKPISLFHETFKNKKLLIIYGETDWCPVKHGEEFRTLLGEDLVEIDIVEGAGHMLSTDCPEILTDKILSFLTKQGYIPKNIEGDMISD